MNDVTISRRMAVGMAMAAAVLTTPRALAADSGAATAVRNLAAVVRAEYQDPRMAATTADTLLTKLKAGRYAGQTGDALAAALTADLRAVSHDQHFAVRHMAGQSRPGAPGPLGKARPADPPTPAHPSPDDAAEMTEDAFGFHAATHLPGNVGLLDLRGFPPLYDDVKAQYAAIMTLLGGTDALILDLRKNCGGDGASVARLLSYFYARKPFVVCRYLWRNQPPDETKTSDIPVDLRYGERKPIFVLTSHKTFSAGEEAAYDLKWSKRATIVGEATRGGANPGSVFDLGGDYFAFVSQGRAVSPLTGSNWDGKGVQPDIAVPADKALTTAYRLALQALLKTQSNAARRKTLEEALDNLPR